ncbi:DUF397 domain-containing protein [Thermomonospora curvata]|uniref:DUF397 domain-containing protein n=1 Tax=Thermomonospora curvata (strain ATCC 19995 / DSM 43183 / JCM 3096 / KCTC 9072 / NBRC 15933 / NCIMB 10081 / Henssen B9) TaxID=471852 RepID=D1A3F9_THECD|nr:DUF397 domain-containing protein [Thermomonospora curvata]ACY96084.1 protein of unknown function DUF397 [Thermomonospora curvata DSM 43183]
MNHLIWRKSSYSMNQGGECVEIARLPHAVGIRDSKNPHHGHLTITPNAFRTLTHHIKQEQLTR